MKLLILVGLFCLALSAPQSARAEAGPPLLTDDPWTPGSNHWEVNLAVTTESNHDEFHFEAPLADINYGVGERVQLKYEVPWTISGSAGQSRQSALAASVAGVKWRFLDKERAGFAMSTYPQITFPSPGSSLAGTNNDVQPNETQELLIPIESEQDLGHFKLNEEAGYHLLKDQPSQLAYGLGLAYPVRDGFLILGEVHGESALNENSTALVSNLGTAYDMSQHMTLLVSGGRSVYNSDGSAAKLLSYMGLQFKL